MCYVTCNRCLKLIVDDDYDWVIHPDNPYRIIPLCSDTCRTVWENRHDEETDR